MNLRTNAIALGVAAALGTGAAFAQSAPEAGAYNQVQQYQQAPVQQSYHRHHHRHGLLALLNEEMSAGRLSKKEGTLLVGKIKQMHAERRAERDARRGGEAGDSEMQQPR